MPMRASELRSVKRRVARWALRNSISAGWRGQKARLSATRSAFRALTVRIWPSVLCQNWFSFMGLERMGGRREPDKPELETPAAGKSPPKELIFSGVLRSFALFDGTN